MNVNLSRAAIIGGGVLALVISATSGAVAGRLIGSEDIRDHSIRSQDLAAGSVRGSSINDGAVAGSDLRPSVRAKLARAGTPGPPGADGVDGERGPIGPTGPPGISGQEWVTASQTFADPGAGTTVDFDLLCGVGESALGASTRNVGGIISASTGWPVTVGGVSGWRFRVSVGPGGGDLEFFVNCARVSH